jgi:hypothetical protein
MNAGHLSFRAFIIVFSNPTTAPGFVTKSFKLVGLRKLLAAAPNPPPLALAPAILNACASVATASNSGARLPVNFVGSCVINF